ncbi:hypothetical protein H6G51_07925 [Limnothrix sp. FACHB-708]|uniref:hypothetical protein n=1 Tax=unclassified Limnothrix TaxID=2632864 RepID=UPI001686EC24|nr:MULTISPECIES: hypothetical protein [unclassified Limnothrix]MBD2553203.1 hypothetical protein [Limnothrix sp. FACHB-708]MBD2590773.1 hypothetical protein [Limnothrix sp. FACHB-406]
MVGFLATRAIILSEPRPIAPSPVNLISVWLWLLDRGLGGGECLAAERLALRDDGVRSRSRGGDLTNQHHRHPTELSTVMNDHPKAMRASTEVRLIYQGRSDINQVEVIDMVTEHLRDRATTPCNQSQ